MRRQKANNISILKLVQYCNYAPRILVASIQGNCTVSGV